MFKLKKKLLGHNAALYAVHFNKFKNILMTGGGDKVLASWDLTKEEPTNFSIKTKSAILSINSIGDKFLLVGLFNGDFHIIDLEKNEELKYFPYHKSGIFCTYVNENVFILGSGDGTVSIWNSKSIELIKSLKFGEQKIRSIVAQNENFLIGTSEGNLIEISKDFEITNTTKIKGDGIYSMLPLSNKNALLIATKDAHFRVISNSTKEEIFNIPAHNWPVYKLIKLDNNTIASCSRDKTIKIWDGSTLELIERLSFPNYKGHTHSINNLEWIENMNSLVSISDDKSICIWAKAK